MEVLELLSSNKNIHNVLLQNYPGLAHSRSFSQPLTVNRRASTEGIQLESNLSPTNPERLKDKNKPRRMHDDKEFLDWFKEDNPRRPKGVQLMLVS